MREALQLLDGQRLTVTAIVLKHSMRIGWGAVREPTILLGQVTTDDGALLADHLWFNLGKRLAAAELHLGDRVQLSARVARYRRGMVRLPGEPMCFNEAYGMLYPTRVQVLARVVRPAPEPGPLGPTKAQQLLTAIADLWAELGEPPSLPRVLAYARINPISTVSTLRKLAKAGSIAFRPDGCVITLAQAHERVQA
jgi:hypothetical protein